MAEHGATVETKEDYGPDDPSSVARRWLAELKASEALQLHHSAIVQLYRTLGGGWSPPTAPGP